MGDQKVIEVMLAIKVSLVKLVCQVNLGLLVFLEKWEDQDSKVFKVFLEKWEDLVLKDIKAKLVIVEKREHLGKQVWKGLLDLLDLAGYQDNEDFEEETVVKDLQVLKLAKRKFL